MKSIKILFLLSIILCFNGCSTSKYININPNLPQKPSKSGEPNNKPSSTFPTTQPSGATPTTLEPSPTQRSEPLSNAPKPGNFSSSIEQLRSMTLEEKVGQMFFVRCNEKTAVTDIKQYHLGGFILFANNFANYDKTSIKSLLGSYQSISDIPLLIGVDEEGGTVNRISKYPAFRAEPFWSPQALYSLGGFHQITTDTIEKSKLLLSLGINVNLAPVCDVSTNSSDFIYGRSFGKPAQDTGAYVKTIVKAMKSQKIGSTLKHFPGYGNNIDTHTGVAIDNRGSETFYSSDFLPFEAGIKAGAGSILVCHNIVKTFDPDFPASLSPAIHTILRQKLKFKGVIMTDDLSMNAIKDYTNNENAAVLAVLAGNDLLIASDYSVQIPAVIDAVKNKKISVNRINESVLRILEWKKTLGLFN